MRKFSMQKKLIALAVAALASGAVLAQSNVTVYGTVDVGFAHRGDGFGSTSGSQNAINSGQADTSKIGFTGVEDLGNGNKALFVLEAGFHADNGAINDQLFSEQAFLGLTGNWGTAIAGRLVAPRHGFLASIDPFGAGTVGQYRNVFNDVLFNGITIADVDRVDNAVAYVSPSFSGFNVTAAYATNAIAPENPGNDVDAQTVTVLPRYTNGPLDVGLVYQGIKLRDTDIKVKQWALGGSYDFKVVKLGAFYDRFDVDELDIETRAWLIGATVPFGKNAIQVSYAQSKLDVAGIDGKAKQWALGYTYALSKRTNFYAAYADISNDDIRGATVGDASNAGNTIGNVGTPASPVPGVTGGYQNGFQFGLKHTF
jgi:predicted porin